MELRDLKTFVVLARKLSFNRTAEALNAAQSTISTRIAGLEMEMGVRLFYRIGRKVVLTDAGSRLCDFAQRMIDLEDETKAWVVGGTATGSLLTVRIPETLCVYRLDAVIPRFRERFPLVRLSFTTCALDGLEIDLRQGVTDLAFVYMNSVIAADLHIELLGTEPLVLATAPAHPLAFKEQVGPEDLQSIPLLLAKGDCSYRRRFEGFLTERQVEPGVGIEFASLAALTRCLSRGLGVTIIPEVAVKDEIAEGSIVTLPWSEGTLETGIHMIWHKKKWLSPMLGALMELMREEIGSQVGASRSRS